MTALNKLDVLESLNSMDELIGEIDLIEENEHASEEELKDLRAVRNYTEIAAARLNNYYTMYCSKK